MKCKTIVKATIEIGVNGTKEDYEISCNAIKDEKNKKFTVELIEGMLGELIKVPGLENKITVEDIHFEIEE